MALRKLKRISRRKTYSIFDSNYIKRLVPKLIKQGQKRQVLTIIEKLVQIIKNPANIRVSPNLDRYLKTAFARVAPLINMKPMKKGATTLYTPEPLRINKQSKLMVAWLLTALKKRPEKNFATKLNGELLTALKRQGSANQLQKEQHKKALSLKRFVKQTKTTGLSKNDPHNKRMVDRPYPFSHKKPKPVIIIKGVVQKPKPIKKGIVQKPKTNITGKMVTTQKKQYPTTQKNTQVTQKHNTKPKTYSKQFATVTTTPKAK